MKNPITISILGDIHLLSDASGLDKFRNSIKGLVHKLKKPDFIVFMGDVVYQLNKNHEAICNELFEEPYKYFLETMNEYAGDIPYIYVAGNHEYPQNNMGKEITDNARNLYIKYSGFPIDYVKEFASYKFIVLGCNDWLGHSTIEGESFAIKEIEKSINEDENRPVFLILHKPIKGTIYTPDNYPMLYSEKFFEYLKTKPQVINFVADHHIPAQDPKTIHQNGFTSIHTPMTALGLVCNNGCDNVTSSSVEPPFSQALSMEITNSKVEVKRVNTIDHTYIDEPWVIDVKEMLKNKSAYLYTDDRLKNSKAPIFPKGAVIKSIRINDIVTLSFLQATTDTKADNGNGFTQYYEIHIKDVKTDNEIMVKKYVRKYWIKNIEPLFKCEIELEKGYYDITIYPLNPFNKKGNPINCIVNL